LVLALIYVNFDWICWSWAGGLVLAFIGVFTMVTDEARAAGGASREKEGRSAPFFMFTTSRFANDGERDGVLSALRKYVTNRDYLSVRLAQEVPELGDRVGRGHLYAMPPSLVGIQLESARGCGPGTPGLIVYDPEHWPETPADERLDVPAAITRGKVVARRSGCHNYGVAPDGLYIGIRPNSCSYDLSVGIHRAVDWDGVNLFDIQAQRLLGDECSSHNGFEAYVEFVAAVTREVRARTRDLEIVAQVSFRYTPPERMIAAIQRLRETVDGFYIAYPSRLGQICAYCSATNLEQVLEAIRD
jgi:hypothetical protein